VPQVIVKLWPARSEERKRRLAARIAEEVYRPDIRETSGTLYEAPGSTM